MRKIILWLLLCLNIGIVLTQPALAQPLVPDVDIAEKELVAAFSPTRLVLDPVHAFGTQDLQISTAIYEGLVTYHPITLQPVLGVAENWEISDDGRTYRFFLRETARYSNGDRVTAGDFRNSWMRILDPGDEGEYSFLFDVIKGASEYRRGLTKDPATVEIRAVSDTLLEVKLAQPASHFLFMLCHMTFVPVHPEYQNRTGWDRGASIIGNGPFNIVRRTSEEMVLARNGHYWDRENVKLERIRIRFMNDRDEITRGLNGKRIHWAETGDTEALRDRDAIQFYPLFGTSYMYFLTDKAPWNDSRVRRALALFLPWESVREEASVFATDKLVPSLSFYPEVEGIASGDVEKSLSLLSEAGYPEGRGLSDILIRVPKGSSAEVAARKIATVWEEKLPIRVRVEASDYQDYLREIERKDHTLASMTWIGDFPDPLTFLQMWTSVSRLNEANYQNPRFDALIEEAMASRDDTRYAKLAEAERMLLNEAVVLPLSHPPAFNLINLDRIDGWFPNPLDIHPFKYLRFKVGDLPRMYASRRSGPAIDS
jgi:peptide/nickel transport system substrate-binding protein/oligopeptide transport system substrate-binding protein